MTKIVARTFLVSCVFLFIAFHHKTDENLVIRSTQKTLFSISPGALQEVPIKVIKNIPYDTKEKTQFDIWMPESKTPTGLLMFTHGGGFIQGDKDVIQNKGRWPEIRSLLSNNIAVASVNYSFLKRTGETEGVLKSMNDVKRALQYIRSRASEYNIDKSKIVLAGGSAGAGTSLWIATNDDMADPNSKDPILRESTRVKGVAIRQTQSTYNIQRWIDDVFADYGLTFDQMISIDGLGQRLVSFYGMTSLDNFNDPAIVAYRKKVDMLSLLTTDDPEIWVENTSTDVVPPTTVGILNHHAYHARAIKERADSIGVPIVAYYGKDPLIYGSPSKESWVDFIIRKVNE